MPSIFEQRFKFIATNVNYYLLYTDLGLIVTFLASVASN